MDPVVDLKELYNNWRQDVQSWMEPQSLAAYTQLQEQGFYQAAHQLRMRTFNVHLFQVGRDLSNLVNNGNYNFDDLALLEQHLVQRFDTRESVRSTRSAAPPADN